MQNIPKKRNLQSVGTCQCARTQNFRSALPRTQANGDTKIFSALYEVQHHSRINVQVRDIHAVWPFDGAHYRDMFPVAKRCRADGETGNPIRTFAKTYYVAPCLWISVPIRVAGGPDSHVTNSKSVSCIIRLPCLASREGGQVWGPISYKIYWRPCFRFTIVHTRYTGHICGQSEHCMTRICPPPNILSENLLKLKPNDTRARVVASFFPHWQIIATNNIDC